MPESTKLKHRFDFSQPTDYFLLAFIMGLMGAFFWAIRGTTGFGGSQGGLLAGLGWGILWFVFSSRDIAGNRRPYSTPWMLAAITFGIAYGGLTGYGVYIAWLSGNFYLNFPEGVRDIAPWTGYTMLFFCGLHWGGVTGAFMAWCGPNARLHWWGWLLRIGSGMLGALIALYVVRSFPQWFLPFYAEGIYEVEENRTCIRAAGSIRNIAPHVGFYFGFLVFEIIRRDWRAVSMMLVMGLGFAIPFTIGGYWQTFHGTNLEIDWWKNWEMTIGLGGGLAFGLAFYLLNRPEIEKPVKMFSAKSYALGVGFPIWFASGIVFRNVLKGINNLHELNLPDSFQVWFSLIYLIPATIVFVFFISKTSDIQYRQAVSLGALSILILFTIAIYKTPLLYLVPATILIGLLVYPSRKTLDHVPVPEWVLIGTLKLIVVVGFIVSFPVPLQLFNKVLLVLYVIFIIGSLVCLGVLLRRGAHSS